MSNPLTVEAPVEVWHTFCGRRGFHCE